MSDPNVEREGPVPAGARSADAIGPDPVFAARYFRDLLTGENPPPEGPWVASDRVPLTPAHTPREIAQMTRAQIMHTLRRAGASRPRRPETDDWASVECQTLKVIVEHHPSDTWRGSAVTALPLDEFVYVTDWGLRVRADLRRFVARIPDAHPDLRVVLAYWLRLLNGATHLPLISGGLSSTWGTDAGWVRAWWDARDQKRAPEERAALASVVAEVLDRADDAFALDVQQLGWLEQGVFDPIRACVPLRIRDRESGAMMWASWGLNPALLAQAPVGHEGRLDFLAANAKHRDEVVPSLVAAAGMTRPGYRRGEEDRVRRVATLAKPEDLAALVAADPRRWWPVIHQALTTPRSYPASDPAPPVQKSGGNSSRPLPQAQWDQVVASFQAQHLRELGKHLAVVHASLAARLQHLTQRSLAGRVVEADQVWLHGDPLWVQEPLLERLVWLLDNAHGPGFEVVLGMLADHPEVKIRRRVAKHTQTPAPLWMEMFNDEDRWVRFGATDQLGRSLDFAAGSEGLAGPGSE